MPFVAAPFVAAPSVARLAIVETVLISSDRSSPMVNKRVHLAKRTTGGVSRRPHISPCRRHFQAACGLAQVPTGQGLPPLARVTLSMKGSLQKFHSLAMCFPLFCSLHSFFCAMDALVHVANYEGTRASSTRTEIEEVTKG